MLSFQAFLTEESAPTVVVEPLTELFARPMRWWWKEKPSFWHPEEEYRAEFEFVERRRVYRYDVLFADPDHSRTNWYVTFGPTDETAEEYGIDRYEPRRWKNQVLATQILTTVHAIVKDFVRVMPDTRQLELDSGQASRTKLYQAMASRLLPGWTVRVKRQTDGSDRMVLRRDVKP